MKGKSYIVIGPAYHPDFSAAEAFLGHDFYGWERLWDREIVGWVFNKEGHPIRQTDPRLDGVPLEDEFGEVGLTVACHVGVDMSTRTFRLEIQECQRIH